MPRIGRHRRSRSDGEDAVLADAQEARREEERKTEQARPVQDRLGRLAGEDQLAELFRQAFGQAR